MNHQPPMLSPFTDVCVPESITLASGTFLNSCPTLGKVIASQRIPFYQINSVFNNSALPPRNWFNPDVTLARLKASLEVLAVGHLNCRAEIGTHFSTRNRGAISRTVVSSLDGCVRHFALAQSLNNNLLNRCHSDESFTSFVGEQFLELSRGVSYISDTYEAAVPSPAESPDAQRGDYCLLHSDRVAVPNPGEAATACLEKILGHDHPLLKQETLLHPDPPARSAKRKHVARAHTHKGEWAKIVSRMQAAGMCSYEEPGTVLENSVFGVLKSADVNGPQRLIFSGDLANDFFAEGSGTVELPNPDVLSSLRLAPGEKLYLASADISQCYNRLRVPKWMRYYLGMPRLWSTEVGVGGTRRQLVPVLTVLPMGIIPAVRLCQAATTVLCRELPPSRIVTQKGPFNLSAQEPLLDVVYLDDINTLGTNRELVNNRNEALAEKLHANGLPIEDSKRRVAVEGVDGEALGLCFGQDGVLSVTPAYFNRLRLVTESLLVTRACSPRHLAHVVGSWVYACLLRRSTLSVLASVYCFIGKPEYNRPRPLPAECLRELFLLLDLAPIMRCSVMLSEGGRVYATDASETGSGVTYLDTADIPSADKECLNETTVRKGWQGRLMMLDEEGAGVSHKLHVSADFRTFFARHEFTVAIASRWKHKAHINTLELESLLLAVRHARRSPQSVLTRTRFGLDSTVALGVASKGRSSSPELNWVARKLCCQLILGGIQPIYFWIPTKLMPADEPSRRV